jgi:arylsulfatase A-like enzyme
MTQMSYNASIDSYQWRSSANRAASRRRLWNRVLMRCLSSVLALSFTSVVAAADKPNIVMIIGDDQAWTDYGFMGSKIVATPYLDKLAKQGLVFERGYVPSSLCRPSLATMATGLFPHQHGIMSNDPPYPRGVRPADRMKNEQYLNDRARMVATFERSPNLAKLLGRCGYISHQSGKWWEGNSCRCGFTEGMTHGDPTKGGRHGDDGLTIGRRGLQPVFDFLDKARRDSKPFYLWYAPMMPHSPHNPPARLLEKYARKTPSIHVARYWAMCEWFDETVGALLAKLELNGQAADTIVVYLHDNGWIQDPDSPGYAPRSKQSPYDGGLRTPIVIRWPGKTRPERSSALASSIDLAPTLLNAAGLKPTPEMTGIDLLDRNALSKRDVVFGEVFLHTAVDLEKPKRNLRYRWLIQGRWKLIVPESDVEPNQSPELFDLSDDPREGRNLAAEHPGLVVALSKTLDGWWKP